MSLCINPSCLNPDNPDNLLYCQSCNSELLLEGRYRVKCLLSDKGGFGKTFIVNDSTNIPKVLKVLIRNGPKAIEQFKREAEVLTRLNHPGIPQAEEDFTFYPQSSKEPVHCLVMEKIEGENLQEWLEKRGNRPISERQALDWLKQLADTLHSVHEQQLIHRDIKPSNIMLKPDGQLVLIDFGIARELTKTYEQKQALGKVTKVVSAGYSPLEQVTGCAVPQSDFFALGRTFVHLLTGVHPTDIADYNSHDLYTDELENWRDKATQISLVLADFIDNLMARLTKNRPASTAKILQQLVEIDQTLHPRKLTRPKSSNSLKFKGKNIALEKTLASWYSGHFGGVRSVAISPDGQTLISGGTDNRIIIWNLNTGQPVNTINKHSGEVFCVVIDPSGQKIISGSGDKTIKMWYLKTGVCLDNFNGHSDGVFALAISPDGNSLVSGSLDGSVKLWDLCSGKEICTLFKSPNIVTAVAISPDGQTLVSGDNENIMLWPNRTFEKHLGSINYLAISSDNQILVSSSSDKTIKVWNINTGEDIYTIDGEEVGFGGVAISPDCQILASGNEKGEVYMWDLSTGEEICNLSGHGGGIPAITFSPDGELLVTGSWDGTIKVWRIQ